MNARRSIDPYKTTHQLVDAAKSAFSEAASGAGANLHKVYAESKERLDHAIDAASDGVEKAEDLLIRKIKEQPVTSAAVALGAGIFIGLMISRRK
jgi:ElaB/YqjD/DUF883 family membrane-anchored ribosome-binding protein